MDDHLSRALDRAQESPNLIRNWTKPDPESKNGAAPKWKGSIQKALEAGAPVELDQKLLQRNHVLSTTAFEDSLVSDSYRLLRTRIRQLMKPRDWNKLGITSPSAKEGKSLTATNLAIIAARDASRKVVLIDGDMRRPSIFEYFGIEADKGLSDYLAGNTNLEDVVYRPSILPNLYIIPTRVASEELMEESLGDGHIQELLNELSSEDVFTIVDLPPALVADDVLSLAPLLDGLLIVVRDGQSSSADLKSTIELLSDVSLLGTVLNDSPDAGKDSHGYYYSKQTR